MTQRFYVLTLSKFCNSRPILIAAAISAFFLLSSRIPGRADAPSQASPVGEPGGTRVQPRLIYQLRHTDPVEALAFSPDSKLLATAGRNKLVDLWDMATGKMQKSLAGHTAAVEAIAFSPDGTLVASGGGDTKIIVWEVETGKVLATLAGHEPEVDALAFSPDAKLLASGGWDNSVSLWNVEAARRGQQQVRTVKGHKGRVTSVAFSPDGKILVSAGWDDTVRFWNPLSGQLLHTLTEHADWVQSICFSPDGKLLASAGWDQSIKIWDVPAVLQGRKLEKYTFAAHDSVISSVQFLPGTPASEPLLASASWDKRVLLWNLQTQKTTQTLSTQRDWVQCLAASAGGKYLASGSFDGMVRVWQMQ